MPPEHVRIEDRTVMAPNALDTDRRQGLHAGSYRSQKKPFLPEGRKGQSKGD